MIILVLTPHQGGRYAIPTIGLNVVRGYCLSDGVVNQGVSKAWRGLGRVVGFVPAHAIFKLVGGGGGLGGWARVMRVGIWMIRVQFPLAAKVPIKVDLVLVLLDKRFGVVCGWRMVGVS